MPMLPRRPEGEPENLTEHPNIISKMLSQNLPSLKVSHTEGAHSTREGHENGIISRLFLCLMNLVCGSCAHGNAKRGMH